jgi:hypothetical protein
MHRYRKDTNNTQPNNQEFVVSQTPVPTNPNPHTQTHKPMNLNLQTCTHKRNDQIPKPTNLKPTNPHPQIRTQKPKSANPHP